MARETVHAGESKGVGSRGQGFNASVVHVSPLVKGSEGGGRERVSPETPIIGQCQSCTVGHSPSQSMEK